MHCVSAPREAAAPLPHLSASNLRCSSSSCAWADCASGSGCAPAGAISGNLRSVHGVSTGASWRQGEGQAERTARRGSCRAPRPPRSSGSPPRRRASRSSPSPSSRRSSSTARPAPPVDALRDTTQPRANSAGQRARAAWQSGRWRTEQVHVLRDLRSPSSTRAVSDRRRGVRGGRGAGAHRHRVHRLHGHAQLLADRAHRPSHPPLRADRLQLRRHAVYSGAQPACPPAAQSG